MPTKKPSAKRSKNLSVNTLSPLALDIIEGLHEATAHFAGSQRLTVKRFEVPGEVDVKAIRAKTRLSQADFASKFGFNRRTLQDWECGRSQPETPVRAYLRVIERAPAAVEEALFTI